MKKRIITWMLMLCILSAVGPCAGAISLTVDSRAVSVPIVVRNNTSYVPLRAVTNLLYPRATVSWVNNEAVVTSSNLTLTAHPGECYLTANGRELYIKDGVKLINGSTMVPIRVLAKALGASVTWNSATDQVLVTRGSGTIIAGDQYYDSSSVYWLSRIIYAESGNEPFLGKIAVGNVILNRVKSTEFPNSIYDVIFDTKWGIQFEPVANGTIYNTPNEDCILAAKLCLDGASVVGNCLYFLDPLKAENLWTVKNCTYVATIGNHQFYL